MWARSWRVAIGCVGVAALLVSVACGSSDVTGEQASSSDGAISSGRGEELVVCISGMVTPEEGLPYYQGLSEYVAEKAGMRLRLIHKAEYAELNELLKTGEVDMAFSCSGPYVAGHDDFGLELLAAPVVNGSATYQAYIIVSADSDATSLDSLEGRTFAFTDPDSNTGCLVPTYMLSLEGTTPEKFFGRVIYTYSHDNSIKAVATGEVDGASVDSLIWEYTNATDPEYTSQTKIIARSEPSAIPPVVVRPDLDPEVKAKLREAFLTAHDDPEGRALLEQMHIERFIEIDDSAFDSVREMADWVAAHGAP
jgi:phosphonate transport system substrate-binding protein